MFASCSAWACWIPATMAWKDKRGTWCNNTWTVFAMGENKKGTKIQFILEMCKKNQVCVKQGMVRTKISDKISLGETG